MIIVSDNSALSCLAQIGHLDLLRELFRSVVITTTIQREGLHPRAPQALRALFTSPPEWLRVIQDPIPYLPQTHSLDPGEASAITLAWVHRESSLLIIDEKRGRRIASALGLRITGAAGLLADASRAGLVDFDSAMQLLATSHFRLAPAIIEDLRRRL